MSALLLVIFVVLGCISCVWFALFVLSWLDGRHKVDVADVPEPAECHMRRPHVIDYFTILPVYWLLFLLLWPAFVGARLGRSRRDSALRRELTKRL